MRAEFLPYSPPTIHREEIDEVVDTLRSNWITTGPKTRAFEVQFGEYVQAPGAASLMLNSCTAGLHLALVTLGIGPGDEVIVPTLTFAATANVVEHVGATPVLVDVLPDTLCIDPMAARQAVTPRTRAIMPVHYAGHPAEMDEIAAIAHEFGLAIVEDAAHALPASYKGKTIGSGHNFAAFSFYATKNMTTGEGGALTGPPELLERARVAALHGMSADGWRRYEKNGSWCYDIVAPGFKYNMTDIQAALGIHQLRRLASFHERRRQISNRYCRSFSADPALEVPIELGHVRSAWHLYVLRLRPERLTIDRDSFIRILGELNIGTSVHFIPLHTMSFYREKYGYCAEQFPVATAAFERMLSIPLHPGLGERDVDDVVNAVLETVERHRS
ncbi:MAG TPA: DegT/DnrJ/EryC1/StrS aminotransferase family protein [Trueperaceae bacterium]